MSGTNVVASMVVFTNGVSDRANYRKFKTRIEHNDDFYNMNETITRRLSDKNLREWGKPDLILIDGGKGQLDAALRARNSLQGATLEKTLEKKALIKALKRSADIEDIVIIGLAKKEEQIVVKHEQSNVVINKDKLKQLEGYLTITDDFTLINLPNSTHIIKLLQRIRDESHRFAVSYHTALKRIKQTAGGLEEIPGIGSATRRKLTKAFGSLRAINEVPLDDIAKIVGKAKAELVHQRLHG
jgi:excinuclease ABC subunit C